MGKPKHTPQTPGKMKPGPATAKPGGSDNPGKPMAKDNKSMRGKQKTGRK